MRIFHGALVVGGPGGGWVRVELPFPARELLGARVRPTVRGTINGHPFRSTLQPNGDGTHHLIVNKEMRAGAGAQVGDQVAIVLEPDAAPRRADVPDELAEALDRYPAARHTFDALPASHRQEYAQYVAGAHQPEARRHRAVTALEMLADETRLLRSS